MSHRGRGGFSGSSYRGSSNRGSWSDSRSSRGGHSTSRGSSSYTPRGGSFASTRGSERSVGGRYWSGSSGGPGGGSSSTFESRSRYTSSPNESSRYSGSRSHAEESFKRPYRADSSTYGGSRDIGHRSPERKRVRSEVQGDRSPRAISSSRRSHEGGSYAEYNTNGSSQRYDSSGERGGSATQSRYSGERRQFSSSERRPSSSGGFRPPAPPREEYRKPSGPPPSPRGAYRGRPSSRGLTRREVGFGKRRVIESSTSSSFLSRSRVTVRSSEYLRKLRLAKLRSAASRRIISSRKFQSRPTVRRRSSEKKENWDDDEKDADNAADKKKSDDKPQSDNEKPSKKSPKVNGASPSAKDGATKEKDVENSDNEPRSRYTGRRFIRLTCVHCYEKSVTFKEYTQHLVRKKHLAAMRRVASLQKSLLSRMRVLQRTQQRELDKDEENPTKNFCLLCKLNYKQMKSVHQSSEAHKEMKRFLMPFCKICRITFRSPMLFQNHLCSLEHIKRKAKQDTEEKSRVDGGGGSGNEGELNLDNFLTLDSVGNVDDEEGNESDNKKPKIEKDEDGGEAEDKNKKEPTINVGQEHISVIEVLYCDLCRNYITGPSRTTSEEKLASTIKHHCRTRLHLKRYVRKTEDAALRETAERIHRNNQAKTEASHKEKAKEGKIKKEKENENEKENNDESKDTSKASITDDDASKAKSDKANVDDETGDEKMWADVDKDLGDLLAEVEPGSKSSDEDEEKGGGERYDRFRYSEKGTKEKIDSGVDASKLEEDAKEVKSGTEPGKEDDDEDK